MKSKINKGVIDRNLNDLVDFDPIESEGRIDQGKIQFSLNQKAKIYEDLKTDRKAYEKGKNMLVDFEKKRWDAEDREKL